MINQLEVLQRADSADGTWSGGWDEPVCPTSNTKPSTVVEFATAEKTFDELGVDEIEEIRGNVNDLKSYCKRIQNLQSEYLNAVNQEEMSAAMRQVDKLLQESLQLGQKTRLQLEAFKKNNAAFEENQSVNSTKVAWRSNQCRSLIRALKDATRSIQSATDNFRSSVAKRHVRNYCIVADVDETEKATIEKRAEEDPYGLQAEIMEKIGNFGVSDSTIDKIEYLETQNRDIRAIGEAVKNLNWMFEQMATMVYEQGDMVDCIAHNVEQTRDHIMAGKISIDDAIVYQTRARKKKVCILIMCITIVIILIVIPISV